MGTCQSCGRDGEDVAAVQRVYLLDLASPATTADDRTAGATDGTGDAAAEPEDRIRVEDEVEYWCWTCRESFPHVLLDPDGEPAPGAD